MTCPTLFITGAQRSGTSLIARLLDQTPAMRVLSQPFPLLFVAAKRQFLRARGTADLRYPLGHLFREQRYQPHEFEEFLLDWRPSRVDLRKTFEEMQGYSGQYTRFEDGRIDAAIAALPEDAGFLTVVTSLLRELIADAGIEWRASKETTCEEYLPPMLAAGIRGLLIIRDPRDVIASLNHGRGFEFAGAIKPTLFNIRSWRKSVAFALALRNRAGFVWCRYEDLVRDSRHELERICHRVGLPAFSFPEQAELRLPDGSIWRGNSSQGDLSGISSSRVGSHESLLTTEAQRLIEAACLPELTLLGYEHSMSHAEALETLASMREPYPVQREGLEGDAANEANAAIEVERLERVATAPDAQSRSWFLFEETHAALREVYPS